nr:hypothetical protein [Nitrosomonas nitrosa]
MGARVEFLTGWTRRMPTPPATRTVRGTAGYGCACPAVRGLSQLVGVDVSDLHQMAEQPGFERGVAMHGHGNPLDAACFGVNRAAPLNLRSSQPPRSRNLAKSLPETDFTRRSREPCPSP